MRNTNPNIREAKVSKACGCLMDELINQRRWFKCSVVQTAIARITTFFQVRALFVMIAVIRRTERVELQMMKTMFVWYEALINSFLKGGSYLLEAQSVKRVLGYIGSENKRRN
ncbi:MAG: hypothetical protein WC315_07150 [Candidatus Omnitrophota bacterium]|jgi:hypothetical protein